MPLLPGAEWTLTFCTFFSMHYIREFDISRKCYVRGCLHKTGGEPLVIPYKKKPSENKKIVYFSGKVTGSQHL